jgi:hypothetical protein
MENPMADLTKATGYTPTSYVSAVAVPNVSLATVQPGAEHTVNGLLTGEAISAGDACYVKNDGKIWRSTGAAANAAAVVDGFAAENAAVGTALTLYHGVVFNYSAAGMTAGTPYYLSTNAGKLSDATTTGGTVVIARAIDSSRLAVRRSW